MSWGLRNWYSITDALEEKKREAKSLLGEVGGQKRALLSWTLCNWQKMEIRLAGEIKSFATIPFGGYGGCVKEVLARGRF